MKRCGVALAAAVLLLAAAPASGASPTACGNFVQTSAGKGYWTYHIVYGYTPVYNLTTRGVRCSAARPFSLRETARMAHYMNGFTCSIRWFNGEDWDIRCTRGEQVVRWQGGA